MSIYTLTNEQRGLCRNGHPWEGDNILVQGDGTKRCRTCVIACRERYKAVKKKYGIRFTKIEQQKYEERIAAEKGGKYSV